MDVAMQVVMAKWMVGVVLAFAVLMVRDVIGDRKHNQDNPF